jgi:hypothetical protein
LENTSVRFEEIQQTFEHGSIAIGDAPILFVKIRYTSGSASIVFVKIHQTFGDISIEFEKKELMDGFFD